MLYSANKSYADNGHAWARCKHSIFMPSQTYEIHNFRMCGNTKQVSNKVTTWKCWSNAFISPGSALAEYSNAYYIPTAYTAVFVGGAHCCPSSLNSRKERDSNCISRPYYQLHHSKVQVTPILFGGLHIFQLGFKWKSLIWFIGDKTLPPKKPILQILKTDFSPVFSASSQSAWFYPPAKTEAAFHLPHVWKETKDWFSSHTLARQAKQVTDGLSFLRSDRLEALFSLRKRRSIDFCMYGYPQKPHTYTDIWIKICIHIYICKYMLNLSCLFDYFL